MNDEYPLAMGHDPDFNRRHPYTKSNGDGSPRGYCRCGRCKADPLHDAEQPDNGGKKEA